MSNGGFGGLHGKLLEALAQRESGSHAERQRIALFPLHTVLFPGGPLPLRIFETRYTDMVRRCTREQQPFGVVLIQEGEEAGPVATTATVGCSARIADFYTLQDGLLGIACVGERKFRVQRVWRDADGLNLGRSFVAEPRAGHDAARGIRAIRRRPCGARSTSSRSTTSTSRRIRRRRLGRCAPHRAPADRAQRQAGVLELDDPIARLDALLSLVPRRREN